MAKVGRKRKHFRTSWGDVVGGLTRQKDGRWRCIDCGHRWSRDDERLAVADFQRHQERDHHRETVAVSLGQVRTVGKKGADRLRQRLERDRDQGPAGTPTLTPTDDTGDAAAPANPELVSLFDVGQKLPAHVLWAWMRQQLIERPEESARRCGIPELARLADLPKRTRSPTLKELGELYFQKSNVTGDELQKSKTFWREFRRAMTAREIETLRGMTAEAVAEYGDELIALVRRKGYSPVYLRQRFGKVKTVINFARKRGKNPDDCRHAIDCCAVLVPPPPPNKDPQPIPRETFHAMLALADVRMRAAMLCGLNLSLSPSEITAIDWDELDLAAGTYVSSRNKTGFVRVGVLWPRTLEALQALSPPEQPRPGEPVFRSSHKGRLATGTLRKDWHALRNRVGSKVKLDSLKDGAQTAAISGGALEQHAKLLAGQSCGITDHYARRNPKMVADACDAIEREYFG